MLTERDFTSIRSMIEEMVPDIAGRRDAYFVTGTVIKNDLVKKLVWLAEFQDQPIPIVGFDYTVKFYDETPQGTNYGSAGSAAQYTTRVKTIKAAVVVPPVGSTVLVAREMGTARLPRCLGVILGTGWIIPGDE